MCDRGKISTLKQQAYRRFAWNRLLKASSNQEWNYPITTEPHHTDNFAANNLSQHDIGHKMIWWGKKPLRLFYPRPHEMAINTAKISYDVPCPPRARVKDERLSYKKRQRQRQRRGAAWAASKERTAIFVYLRKQIPTWQLDKPCGADHA